MSKIAWGCVSAAGITLAFSAWAAGRPVLTECGDLLPEGVSYSVNLDGTWDTRRQPASGAISITLKDELRGETPDPIPDEAAPFVACVRSAVGV